MSHTTREIAAPAQPQALIPPPAEPASPKEDHGNARPGQPNSDPPRPNTGDGGTPHGKHKRWWLYVLLAVALAAIAFVWYAHRNRTPVAQKAASAKTGRGGAAGAPTSVVTTKARMGDIGVYITGLGSITPLATVTVRSRVDGQLMKVYFKEGEYVRMGDPLIEIDPRPYQATLEQAEGQLARDQALLANATVDVNRYQTLLKEDAIPEQQLATQQALVKEYRGSVKNDEGALDAARVNVSYCDIVAPISGIVGLRLVDAGNIVHASDSNGMLVITQIEPISVIFTVSEDQLPEVLRRLRNHQKLSVEAWDRELMNKLAMGRLETVDNEIDPTTGTLKLRAVFENKDRALFPNEFVNARLLLQQKSGVTLLPAAAIQRNTTATYVYLVKPDNTVTIRPITVGTTEGDRSEITSGLMPGDQVVLTGVDKLEEGSRIVPHLDSEGDRDRPVRHRQTGPAESAPSAHDGGVSAGRRGASAPGGENGPAGGDTRESGR